MKLTFRLLLCWMISFSLIELPMIKSAHAGMIKTNTVVELMTRAQTEQKVVAFMGRSEVKQEMIKLGVNPEEAALRVAHLSDSELRKVAGEIDHSMAGGDIGGILIIVLLVLLIIYFAKRI